MNLKHKLRNNLVRKIQKLSTEKLTEINELLNKIENKLKSKEKTLNLAGSWKDLDNELLNEFTTQLHHNRSKDRQID